MKIRVGTRSSRLAMAQTRTVTTALESLYPEVKVELLPIRTMGDRLPPEKRGGIDGKAAFTRDIESLLIHGEVDIAVHSMKDLPWDMNRELTIAAVPARGDRRDALISMGNLSLDQLPPQSMIGTGSVRRRAQLLALRRDLRISELHGNVETRLSKVGNGFDAVVLAAAGVQRLGLQTTIAHYFTLEEMVPAAGQGLLAVQCRVGDADMLKLLGVIDDPVARAEAECERAFLLELKGDCDVPAGASATVSGGEIRAVGIIASPDGREIIRGSANGPASEAKVTGKELVDDILGRGGYGIRRGVLG